MPALIDGVRYYPESRSNRGEAWQGWLVRSDAPLAALAASNGDQPARFRGSYAALNWLAKPDRQAAVALMGAIMDSRANIAADADNHGHMDPHNVSTDDIEAYGAPDDPLRFEAMADPAQDGPDELRPEVVHEVKPDIHEMLRSAGGMAWPWCGKRVVRN